MFKALSAFGAGEAAILAIGGMLGSPIVVGVVTAILVSVFVDWIFDEWKISDKVVEGLKGAIS